MTRRILPALLVLSACLDSKPAAPPAPAEPVTRTTTAAVLESLPRIPVTDGRLVCLSDGENPCPASAATANWLHDGHFATWEQHRQILVWTPNKTDPQLLGEIGPNEAQYDFVVSVAATRLGYIVLNASGMRALRYGAKGNFESSTPFPPVSITHATGYSGDVPFYQVIHEAGKDSAAEFEVREIDSPGDTTGRTVLKTKLNWLRVRDGRPVVALPLFPLLPSYAIAADSDVVWGVGDRFAVERRSAAGKLRWSLTSDATGPAVTPDEIDTARKRLPEGGSKTQRANFDSSVAVTARFHQAVGAIILAADGRVLVAGTTLASRDSVQYTVLGNTGQPTGRFSLPRAARVLLFDGDSLLIQRSGANAQQELRWLNVKSPAKP
jgi:hypothetical protein